jgi:EpsI family protein
LSSRDAAALRLDDYLLADYRRGDEPVPVNLYVAWYDSQRAGQSAHSPRSCLPGGGWRIDELDQITLPGTEDAAQPLRVNRVLIGLGNNRQLVYYWFQQRGRVITNEYLVKWYLFLDAIGRQRTDGALVRLTTPLQPGEDPARGDERLAGFAAQAVPRLSAYVPE